MNGYRESDSLIVSKKPLNKTGDNKPVAEEVEKRRLAERNPSKRNRDQAQSWIFLPNELDRIRYAAQRSKDEQFISLWHHVYDVRRLTRSFYSLKHNSAGGIDGMTWNEYGRNLRENIKDLSERLRKGAYRARAVKRIYIPKGDGRQRPIGIPTVASYCTSQLNGLGMPRMFVDFGGVFDPLRQLFFLAGIQSNPVGGCCV